MHTSTELFNAIENLDASTIERLLANGADPNAVNAAGETAVEAVASQVLYDVSWDKLEAAVLALLKAGADPRRCSDGGVSALGSVAWVEQGHRVIAQLINAGADKEARVAGETPLLTAVAAGHLANTQLLLKLGCNPNVCNDEGETPLSYSATSGSTAIMCELLQHGADPNATDAYGSSPLMHAVMSPDRPLASVQLLIEYGSNPDHIDDAGETPLSMAFRAFYEDAAVVLIEKCKSLATNASLRAQALERARSAGMARAETALLRCEHN